MMATISQHKQQLLGAFCRDNESANFSDLSDGNFQRQLNGGETYLPTYFNLLSYKWSQFTKWAIPNLLFFIFVV